ncbi:MgtC/SapB family protein [Polyangium sp. y55x31]|uniref:MgtC/SapB family protein n=1 Tax=Polyangium sp. y55x31 TaxID=3042688 RepID=UPI0024829B58|nr:MgtC/SapB family protein [Polyangium sp. y55x31]MDI1480982.1 MgtC/SapB family protein [Polyangium sp. y55x31]
MTFQETLISLAVAVGAGGLIGAERQQAQILEVRAQEGRERPQEFGGIRTFPLIALLGALGALARPIVGAWLLGMLLFGVIAFMAVSHLWSGARGELGISSEIAGLVTFVLGAIAVTPDLVPHPEQRYLLVASSAVATLALLALKRPMHRFAGRVSADDVYATVKFLILALIVLPVLPNRTYGPLDVLNPFKIGMMIVLVAGISFAGYLATRLVGPNRGLLLTGLLGGLVSSTAVTLTYAGRVKKDPKIAAVCAVAIAVACSVMFPRMITVVAVVDRPLLPLLTPALGTMGGVGLALSLLLYHRWTHGARAAKAAPGSAEDKRTEEELKLRNPFELRQAVTFGLIYGVVLFVAKAAKVFFGTGGLYVSSVLAGLMEVDAITLSVAEMHRMGLSGPVAATSITLAAVTNTIVKATIAVVVGGGALGKRVGAILGIALLVGGGVLLVARGLG